MRRKKSLTLIVVGLAALWIPIAPVEVQTQDKPVVPMPKPGVPEIMTLEGTFVRAAYNNEGYVILGYQLANRSIGEEWMLLEVGMTVLDRTPAYRLKREALSLETPDGKTLPLPSIEEHRAGQYDGAAESGTGPARLDQLLSADGEPGLRHDVLPGPELPRVAGRRDRSE